MKYLYWFIGFITLLFSTDIYAVTVKGVVLDAETDETLVSVTVVLTTQATLGAITALDGTFVIDVPQLPAGLSFSYIGYNSQKYTVTDNKENIIIRLEPTSVKWQDFFNDRLIIVLNKWIGNPRILRIIPLGRSSGII